MSKHTQVNILPILALVLLAMLLPGALGSGSRPVQANLAPMAIEGSHAAPVVQPRTALFRPEMNLACAAAPADLPNILERTNFCVYYSNNNTLAEATTVADHVEDYWNRYVTDFGFLPPLAAGKLGVHLLDIPGECNGCGNCVANAMTVNSGCLATPECIQKVVGHELFHRVQYSYDPVEAKWMKEGTARAMEDNTFANIDSWTGGSCWNFAQQVDDYLVSTSEDITSDPMKYNSTLWWKYMEEQYGTTLGEPQLGVDAFLRTWQAAAPADNLTAVNNALAALGAGTNFNGSFRRFAVANWTKDLTGVPNGSYSYIDDDAAPYSALVPEPEAGDDGIITVGDSAVWNNQLINNPYGIRYYAATPGVNCPVISASFHKDFGPDAFYHVVTQKGSAFASHVEGSGDSWVQSFLNDGITKIAAIIGSQSNQAQADVTLSCATPVVDIKLPNNGAVAYVGPAATPGKFLAQVLVTNGAPTAPVIAGLTNSDFKAYVNGIEGLVTAGGFIQEQYWLEIEAPAQTANGTYDLEIVLEQPGTSTEIASDTSAGSVTYTSDNTDHVLVVDRSGSMSMDGKMLAAQNAAAFYVDITRNFDGLAVVPFNQDVNPLPYNMHSVDLNVRSNAKTFVRNLTAGGTTSIGDGLQEAVNQRAGSPTGNPRCSFVLLSDGMENTAAYWADVQAAVLASGCPVTAIAFGPESSEDLMQAIAAATAGESFYNDVYVSTVSSPGTSSATIADMALELSDNYEYAQSRAEGRQRLFLEKGVIPYPPVEQTHRVIVDSTANEVLFALDWNQRGIEMELRLRDPNGKVITSSVMPYTFADYQSGHLGWRISKPQPGEWSMMVISHGGAQGPIPYQVLSSAHARLTLNLLLPDRYGSRFVTGNRVPVYAFLSASKPITDAQVVAEITAPDGTLTTLRLFDDGQHGDGAAADGFYGNVYTRVNQAILVTPRGEDAKPQQVLDEGAYRVRVTARHAKFQRQALGAFAVLEGQDQNGNRLPDVYEKENKITDPNADPDLDGLDNLSEYLSGTDPNQSDTDGSGENDGSEVLLHKQDPLLPKDDLIEAPIFFHAEPDKGEVHLTYDVKKDYTRMVLYRANSPAGPWALRQSDLPLTGSYNDPATNGTVYYYRLMALNRLDHRSAVLSSEAVKPSVDPIPPTGRVVINHGARATGDLKVILTFMAFEDEGIQAFSDIVEVQISNDPFFRGAKWQPFAKEIAWQLEPTKARGTARVYVRFRDAAGNESVGTAVGSIIYQLSVYLPMLNK